MGGLVSGSHIGLRKAPIKLGAAGKLTIGVNIVILDDQGKKLLPKKTDAICIEHPTPPSFAPTIYLNDAAFVEKYMSQYSGYYATGDAGYLDEDGYLFVVSRLNDIIKTAGQRYSASQLEEILAAHSDVLEAAVVGAKHEVKSEVPVGFIVLKAETTRIHRGIEEECIQNVHTELGDVASFDFCMVVDKLPKNRSGKVVRQLLQNLINREKLMTPATIEDGTVAELIRKQLADRNSGRTQIY